MSSFDRTDVSEEGQMERRGFLGLAGSGFPRCACAASPTRSAILHWSNCFGKGASSCKPRGNGMKSPSLGSYFLQWYGHSSFLIHSGSQTKVVADPNFNVTPGIQADAVTVSNDHFTHNNTGAVTGNPVILRGITFKQTWNPIRTSVKDITIVNIPSQRSAELGRHSELHFRL